MVLQILWGWRERKREERDDEILAAFQQRAVHEIIPFHYTSSLAHARSHAPAIMQARDRRRERLRGGEDRGDGALRALQGHMKHVLSGMLHMLSHLYMHIQLMLYK